MKRIFLPPMLLVLSACGSPYTTNDDLVSNLALSEGHSECISTRLKAVLDAARVVEVIPRLHKCTVIGRAKSFMTTSTNQCQSQETSV
ncbi:hypothetical protein, partial [Xanthomonas vesicatoria]